MTIKELIESHVFETINIGDDTERTISGLFCCDLLSIAMSKAPADSVWVTVMGNINTLAVAALCDVGCIILAEGDHSMKPPRPRPFSSISQYFAQSSRFLMLH